MLKNINIKILNINIKPKLEEIYEKFVEGAKVRSKCTWYEEGKGTHNSF